MIYWLFWTHEKGSKPMDQARVDSLSSKHAALQAQIDAEEHRPHPDEVALHQLKKAKLQVKDALVGH